MYLPLFCFWPFFLCSVLLISAELCFLDWSFVIVSIKRHFSCKYNASRRLNVCCMKSNHIWSHFIASSFQTSMSYLSWLRAILYCSNNSSLFAILMHGTPLSNGLFFVDEGQIHLSYYTSANQYGSLTCAKYKKLFSSLSRSNENSLFEITAHKTLSRFLSFNI